MEVVETFYGRVEEEMAMEVVETCRHVEEVLMEMVAEVICTREEGELEAICNHEKGEEMVK